MKKILKNLFILLLAVSCNSSKNIHKIESVKFELPKGAVKVEKATLDQNNKKDQKLLQLKNIYRVNNVFIGLSDPFKGEIKKDFLKSEKDGFDYNYKIFGFIESHQYKSRIEKINNNDALVIYTYYENIGQYSFKILKIDNNQVIGGTVIFEQQSDYTQATKIVYDLLNSVKFE